MDTATENRKKPKRKRGRPAKNKIEAIKATPEEIGQALVRAAERKAEERRLQKA
ncbi:MAG: hypothetical protein OXK78_05540 [Caldilineaceae bacterium]|nr:hypothetical protein [Caldilineaceae bacterium]